MLLTLGLTADAAAAHRHEFSGQQQHPSIVVVPTPVQRRTSAPAASYFPARSTSWASSRPSSRPIGLTSPRASLETAPSIETVMTTAPDASTDPSRDDDGRSEDEEDGLMPSDSSMTGKSFAATTTTAAAATRPRRRRRRPKARFLLAHPPPAIVPRQMLHIRPRLLLQLQYLSESARPAPILNVHPATVFAPRLRHKFPRFFKSKESLGPDDLVIVASDEYESSRANESHGGDDWDAHQLIATICRSRKDELHTEICLSDGPSWEATQLKTGAYEFVADDGQGCRTTARWVPRKSVDRRRSYQVAPTSFSAAEEMKKFHFSLLNPQSRVHPILASVTPTTLDVHDVSSSTSSPASRPSSANSNSTSRTSNGMFSSSTHIPAPATTVIQSDEALQTLILITGIWVAFREGWSQNFRYSAPHHRRNSTALTGAAAGPANGPVSKNGPPTTRDRSASAASQSSHHAHMPHFRAPSLRVRGRLGQRSASSVPQGSRHATATNADADADADAVPLTGEEPSPATFRRVQSTPVEDVAGGKRGRRSTTVDRTRKESGELDRRDEDADDAKEVEEVGGDDDADGESELEESHTASLADANGEVDGHTNGNGATNGTANGHTNGHTNGNADANGDGTSNAANQKPSLEPRREEKKTKKKRWGRLRAVFGGGKGSG